jgi:hypothetical protein
MRNTGVERHRSRRLTSGLTLERRQCMDPWLSWACIGHWSLKIKRSAGGNEGQIEARSFVRTASPGTGRVRVGITSPIFGPSVDRASGSFLCMSSVMHTAAKSYWAVFHPYLIGLEDLCQLTCLHLLFVYLVASSSSSVTAMVTDDLSDPTHDDRCRPRKLSPEMYSGIGAEGGSNHAPSPLIVEFQITNSHSHSATWCHQRLSPAACCGPSLRRLRSIKAG